MPFQISPGVNVTEIDLTTIVPAVATTDCAFVGIFNWGPVDEIALVNRQEFLEKKFGRPDSAIAKYWFTASNFLDYGNKLHLVRVVEQVGQYAANNARETITPAQGLLIKNKQNYHAIGSFTSQGKWAAKYPGEFGNNLKVSVCDSGDGQFANTVPNNTSNGIIGDNYIEVSSNTDYQIGDVITFDTAGAAAVGDPDYGRPASIGTAPSGEYKIVEAPKGGKTGALASRVGSDLGSIWRYDLKLNRGLDTAANNHLAKRQWEFNESFDAKPGTSVYAEAKDSANDEIHIAISDHTGKITGTKGNVLEKWPNLSKASDAKTEDGSSNYYVDVINESSKYIWWLDHPADGDQFTPLDETSGRVTQDIGEPTTVGTANSFTHFEGTGGALGTTGTTWLPNSVILQGGANGDTYTNAMFLKGYDFFNNTEEIDISLVIGGPANGIVARYIIESVAEKRKDCVAFISPELNDVTGTSDLSTITNNVTGFRLTTEGINSKSSSYAVMDSGWKYQYDKYNDAYRWVPLNADIAGLCVQTDNTRDPWWSPAGLNRGHIKNLVKLAWNPRKAQRDALYREGVNPVVTLKGQGTVLFGDKTLLSKPSAFDRINVRRLFIVLEKAIATASKFTLFEFNDEFTRAQFVNMVEPFLRDVQGRRGIYDFKVVCDESNNTGEVIDRNEFIGDIYIKPARSINFIQLNFIAVRTGVDFEEIVGKF